MKQIENRNLFLNISSFLLCLIPIALVTGPFLPDLFLSIISLIYLIFFLKNDKLDFLFLKISISIGLAFYFIIILGSIFSENILISLKSSLFYFRFLLFLPAVLFIFNNKKNLTEIFFRVLIISCVIIILDSYFQYLYGKNILGFEVLKISNFDLRVTGMFGKDEILGSYLSKVLPILISFIFLLDIKYKELLTIFLIILFGISIFLSSERSSFIHYLMFSFLFICLSSSNFKKNFFIIILIPIIFLITSFDAGKKHRMIISPFNSLKSFHFSQYHSDHYKTAYKMFLDKKIIGHGVKSFRYQCSDTKYIVSKKSCSTHPHNTYMQLLSETGIFGFLIIILIFFYFLLLIFKIFIQKYFTKRTNFNNSQISIIIGLFVYFWPLSPNGNFFNNWLNVILFMQLAVLLYSFYQYSDKKINRNINKKIA